MADGGERFGVISNLAIEPPTESATLPVPVVWDEAGDALQDDQRIERLVPRFWHRRPDEWVRRRIPGVSA